MKKEVIEFTQSLVRINSVNDNETEVSKVIREELSKHGIKSSLFGENKKRQGLVSKVKLGNGGKTLLLNGHVDTVKFGNVKKWKYDPLSGKIVGKRLYGRGSFDMKCGISSMVHSVINILDSDVDGNINMVFSYDEESGNHAGIRDALKFIKADACLVGEPTDLKFDIGYRGLYRFEIETIGKTAHTGNLMGEGINATTKMSKVLLALEEMDFTYEEHPIFPPPKITPGTVISGGYAVNIVPDSCKAMVDCRLGLGQTRETLSEDLKKCLGKLKQEDKKLSFRVNELSYIPPFLTDESEKIYSVFYGNIEKELGRKPEIEVCGCACDGNIISNAGIPTVVFGPSGNYAHSENEYVNINSISKCLKIYSASMLDFFS